MEPPHHQPDAFSGLFLPSFLPPLDDGVAKASPILVPPPISFPSSYAADYGRGVPPPHPSLSGSQDDPYSVQAFSFPHPPPAQVPNSGNHGYLGQVDRGASQSCSEGWNSFHVHSTHPLGGMDPGRGAHCGASLVPSLFRRLLTVPSRGGAAGFSAGTIGHEGQALPSPSPFNGGVAGDSCFDEGGEGCNLWRNQYSMGTPSQPGCSGRGGNVGRVQKSGFGGLACDYSFGEAGEGRNICRNQDSLETSYQPSGSGGGDNAGRGGKRRSGWLAADRCFNEGGEGSDLCRNQDSVGTSSQPRRSGGGGNLGRSWKRRFGRLRYGGVPKTHWSKREEEILLQGIMQYVAADLGITSGKLKKTDPKKSCYSGQRKIFQYAQISLNLHGKKSIRDVALRYKYLIDILGDYSLNAVAYLDTEKGHPIRKDDFTENDNTRRKLFQQNELILDQIVQNQMSLKTEDSNNLFDKARNNIQKLLRSLNDGVPEDVSNQLKNCPLPEVFDPLKLSNVSGDDYTI